MSVCIHSSIPVTNSIFRIQETINPKRFNQYPFRTSEFSEVRFAPSSYHKNPIFNIQLRNRITETIQLLKPDKFGFLGGLFSSEVCIQCLDQLKLRTSINALMNCILLPSPHHPHPNPTHTNASLHASCQLLTLTSLRKHHSSFNGIEYAKPRQSCDPLNLGGTSTKHHILRLSFHAYPGQLGIHLIIARQVGY